MGSTRIGALVVDRRCVVDDSTAAMANYFPTSKFNLLQRISSKKPAKGVDLKPVFCFPAQKVREKVGAGVICEPCNDVGWLLCNFCQGQKTNVKSETNRIYRRCPTCRAVGYVLCTNCKVFKCVTFPDYSDGEELKCE